MVVANTKPTENTNTNTIQIRGRSYVVEPRVSSRGEEGYRLSGPRGARYVTMRNVNTPHLMFLVDDRGFGLSSVTKGVWLSDEDGELRVVHS